MENNLELRISKLPDDLQKNIYKFIIIRSITNNIMKDHIKNVITEFNKVKKYWLINNKVNTKVLNDFTLYRYMKNIGDPMGIKNIYKIYSYDIDRNLKINFGNNITESKKRSFNYFIEFIDIMEPYIG
jgi:hypothetical protein